MKYLFVFLLIAWPYLSHGDVISGDCFVKHIEEAINLNKERRGLYKQQSGGSSVKISDALIWFERLTLLSARWFDWQAKPWQKKGIPLLCSEFVSMDLTPRFDPIKSPQEEARLSLNIRDLTKSLRSSLGSNEHDLLGIVSRSLRGIESEPNYHCMQRHLIESIGRTAKLIPVYEKMALARGLEKPTPILKQFLGLQIWGLKFGRWLDSMARPLQEKGLGIICNDIPFIPMDIGIDPPLLLSRSTYEEE